MQSATDFILSRPWLNAGLTLSVLALLLYAFYRLLMSDRMTHLRRVFPKLDDHYNQKQIDHLEEIGAYAEAGERLLELKRTEQAITAFQRGNLLNRAAEVCLSKRQFERAAKFYEQVGNVDKAMQILLDLQQYDRAEALMSGAHRLEELAHQYQKRGDPERAAKIFKKLGELEQAAQIYTGLGKAKLAADLYLQAYEDAKKQGFDSPEMGLTAAKALEAAEEFNHAAQVFASLGRSSEAARCYAKAGDKIRAGEIYENMGEISKASTLILEGGDVEKGTKLQAESYVRSGKFKEAAKLFIEMGDYSRAGEIYREMGKEESAAQMFEKAEEFQLAASIFREIGNLSDAARNYEKNKSYDAAAECYRLLNKPEKEAEVYKKKGDRIGLAESLHRLGRTDEALSILDGVTESDPRFRLAVSLKGKMFLNQGDQVRAQQNLELALKSADRLNIDDIESIYNLAVVSEQTGTASSALRILESAIARGAAEKGAQDRAENVHRLLTERAFNIGSLAAAAPYSDNAKATGESTVVTSAAKNAQRYTIVKEIGRGGMGAVFEAKDKTLDRIVALKILHSSFKSDSQAVQTFLREAKSAAALTHPNIVTVHDAGMQEGNYYIAMEMLEGRTIKQILRSKGKIALASVQEVLRQLLDGLIYAHSKKIVHRDLSTNNIMWTRQKTVKIMDFGLAKVIKDLSSEQSIMGGTPSYMSPEQTLGAPIDHRTDIYSLGICMYEMLIGELPFQTGDMGYHHLHTPPPEARAKDSSIPAEYNETILKCMQKKPEERFQNVSEIAQKLRLGR
jgi:eukaryotic-like serine/threonine-protein kinase